MPGRHHAAINQLLLDVAGGRVRRAMIFMPPRHGKSTTVSEYAPAWWLGNFPNDNIIFCSYEADYAREWGRKARSVLEEFGEEVFGVKVMRSSSAAHRWNIAPPYVGAMRTAGVEGPIVGKGADLMIIDDPVKGAAQARSKQYQYRTIDWYRGNAYPRLEPGGAVVIMMCMTGDTPVLLADGSEIPLRDVRAGTRIATYEEGRLSTTRVEAQKSSGVDQVFRITTTHGMSVRANGRHPFLAYKEGRLQWIRLQDLAVGDELAASRFPGEFPGERGLARPATGRAATDPLSAAATAGVAIGEFGQQKDTARPPSGQRGTASGGSSTATASPPRSMTRCLNGRAAYAPSVVSPRPITSVPTGAASSASTTITRPAPSGDSCATTATLRPGISKPSPSPAPWPSTSDFTLEAISSIEPVGLEEVFDLQVERTENFIAGGLVSHNTRWHQNDLAGMLLREEGRVEEGGLWTVLELPAIAIEGEPDVLGRAPGEALWPERIPIEVINDRRVSVQEFWFAAQYQQKPLPEAGGVFKREWIHDFWTTMEDGHLAYYLDGPEHSGGARRYVEGEINRFATVDLATSLSTSADRTVVSVWATTPDQDLLLEDCYYVRIAGPDQVPLLWDVMARWRPGVFGIESGAYQLSLVQEAARSGLPVRELKPGRESGEDRAIPAAARMQQGKVFFKARSQFRDPAVRDSAIEEILDFPMGVHDDFVTTLAYAAKMMIDLQVSRRVGTTAENAGPFGAMATDPFSSGGF